jgi:hypothetical protein
MSKQLVPVRAPALLRRELNTKRPTKSFRPPLSIRNRRRLATKAAWPGGEIAKGAAENGYATLVAPISGWRKVFCDGSKVDSAKVFAQGEAVPTVNRLLRVVVGSKPIVTKLRWRNGASRWCSGARRAVWSRGFLGRASLGENCIQNDGDNYAFFPKSCAGAGGFDATGEHTSGVESRPARNGDCQVWSGR